MKKRVLAGLLAFILIFSGVFADFSGIGQVKAAGATVIVHYGGRADSNYTGWNLWLWPEGGNGKQVDFTSEDSFGKIAIYSVDSSVSQVGVIVRLNEWEDKDISDDRFIQINGDVTEVWITSGVEEIATDAPEGAASYDFAAAEEERINTYNQDNALKINAHFYSFDGEYDNWSANSWIGDEIGGAYEKAETDDFGAVYHIGYINEKEYETAGIKFVTGGNADCEKDRVIDITKAKDNVLDIYIVQGNDTVWYDKAEASLTPIITKAGFVTSKKIEIYVSKTIDTSDENLVNDFKLVDQDGTEYPLEKIWTETLGETLTALVILDEKVDLGNTYTLSIEGFQDKQVSIGEAFSTSEFEDAYYYEGDDLGAVYSKEKTNFRVWAPTASEIKLNLYESGDAEVDDLIESVNMEKDINGTWVYEKSGDLNGTYYTYSVTVDGKTNEAVDPYARTAGVNGNRGMVLDLDSTDPDNFDKDERPEFVNMTDAIIYELHVRDLSSDSSSGITNTGKYLGLTEKGTTNSDGLATGIDHLVDLGITHLQLQPVFDYKTVDESKLDSNQYNWGYDPKNYNVPEGSYSTDPYNGEVRVNEFKQMVQSLHDNDIRVIMDVVYNHTADGETSYLNMVVPNYYYRMNGDAFSNASGCGNETASERAMTRKYIVDSVVYWATEYHIDGFRFDLMGIHDIETMNAIRAALDEVDPSIIIIGEGWTGGDSTLDAQYRAIKKYTYKLNGIAAFSDNIRDGIRGNVFDNLTSGFVSGAEGMEEDIKFGVVACTDNSQIDYELLTKDDKTFWAGAPTQCVTYASCHDNLTLWDRLATSNPDDSEEDRLKMNLLSSAIVYTSQGIPFMVAGEEILRSKPSTQEGVLFDENSYASPDSTNSIMWNTKTDNIDVYNYYKGLIAFRKAHGALRMTTTEEIQGSINFVDGLGEDVVAYTIKNRPNNEIAEELFIIYNANKEAITVELPDSDKWSVYVNGQTAGTNVIEEISGTATVEGISCMVLVKESANSKNATADDSKANNGIKPIQIILVAIVAIVGFIYIFFYHRKKEDDDDEKENEKDSEKENVKKANKETENKEKTNKNKKKNK